MRIRPATAADVPAMARIRADEWETIEYWLVRIAGYLDGTQRPRNSLPTRAAFVASIDDAVIGFVAGHCTDRYGCTGELEWINVTGTHRGRGVASALLRAIAAWFVDASATKVCVSTWILQTSRREGFTSRTARER